MKEKLLTVVAAFGGSIIANISDWGVHLTILMTLMIIDYISGIVLSLWYKKSKKSGGRFAAKESIRGLLRKGMMLCVILVAHLLDEVSGAGFLCNMTTVIFIAHESFSVIENAGMMGVPIPQPLIDAIEALYHKDKLKKMEDKNGVDRTKD